MSKTSLLVPEHVAASLAQEEAQKAKPSTTEKAKPSLEDAYVPESKRVLDPSLISKSLKERLPQPTGWRILVMPYQGKTTTDDITILDAYVEELRNIPQTFGAPDGNPEDVTFPEKP